jgi:hypothetical protein
MYKHIDSVIDNVIVPAQYLARLSGGCFVLLEGTPGWPHTTVYCTAFAKSPQRQFVRHLYLQTTAPCAATWGQCELDRSDFSGPGCLVRVVLLRQYGFRRNFEVARKSGRRGQSTAAITPGRSSWPCQLCIALTNRARNLVKHAVKRYSGTAL